MFELSKEPLSTSNLIIIIAVLLNLDVSQMPSKIINVIGVVRFMSEPRKPVSV